MTSQATSSAADPTATNTPTDHVHTANKIKQRLLRCAVWVGISLLFPSLSCTTSGAIAHSATFGKAIPVGSLSDRRINESSGLAASLRHKDLLWTHNDSGGKPVIYALSVKGEPRGQVELTQAKNIDWEDMTSFQWNNKSWLLIADTGDNRARRDHCTLYVIEEPSPSDGEKFNGTVGLARRIDFRYDEGPRDCEAVAVDILNKQCLLLSKREAPPQLYSVPLFPPPGSQPVTATKITPVPTIPAPTVEDLLQPYGKYSSWPTAMDISPDGRLLLILTYKHAYIYTKSKPQSWASCLTTVPETILLPSAALSPLLQREAMCFSVDGNSLFLTSENEPTPLFRLDKVVEIP